MQCVIFLSTLLFCIGVNFPKNNRIKIKKENQNDKHIKNENKNRRNSGRENRENDTVEIENKSPSRSV